MANYSFKKLNLVDILPNTDDTTYLLTAKDGAIKRVLVKNLHDGGAVKSVGGIKPNEIGNIPLTVNGAGPAENGNFKIDFPVYTVNEKEADENGNFEVEFPVYTVNGKGADSNGNFKVEIPTYTVNGVAPDDNGNFEVSTGTVNTVNGFQPDENGNIQLPDEPVDWNDLINKPFKVLEEGETISWDGNVDGIETWVSLENRTVAFLITDKTFPEEQFRNSKMSIKISQYEQDLTIGSQTFEEYFQEEGILGLQHPTYPCAVIMVTTENATLDEAVFPKTGIYFTEYMESSPDIRFSVTKIDIPDTVQKLDKKFLPEGVGFREFVPERLVEQNVEIESIEDLPFGFKVLNEITELPRDSVCTVRFNDTDYFCETWGGDGITCLGNGQILGTDYGEEVPFLIISDGTVVILIIPDPGNYNISIRIPSHDKFYPIDENFLPPLVGKKTGVSGEIFNDYDSNDAYGEYSHAEGSETSAEGGSAHAEGYRSEAIGEVSHAEGLKSLAIGFASHAEGGSGSESWKYANFSGAAQSTVYTSRNKVEIGNIIYYLRENTFAVVTNVGYDSSTYSYIITLDQTLSQTIDLNQDTVQIHSHVSTGDFSHVQGKDNVAYGKSSHAEGELTLAKGWASHSEGYDTIANNEYSHAEGEGTETACAAQHVQGRYNVVDDKYAHIVGNGSATNKRSNAHTLDWEGNAWYQGEVEATSFILKSSTEGSEKRFRVTADDSGALTAVEIIQILEA